MSQRAYRILIVSILAAFVLLGLVYSVATPLFEASDEKWHYPMVKTIADHGTLPVQQPGVETPWRQEGSQPPLYYGLMAAATFWIDTSDMEAVRHLNPHADAGATPDGNVNLVVHDPTLERFPWRGTTLAVRLIRFLSVLMSAAAVYLTYRLAREVFPERPWLALSAAAIHAFTPMYVFISASVNNDNLVTPLCSLALLMLVRMLKDQAAPASAASLLGRYGALGIVLGLAALAKSSALPLTALTALVVSLRAARRRSWAEWALGGAGTLVPFLAVAGWWFWRNLRLYGDLTGLNVFIEILGKRDVPADLAQLWRERFSFLSGYWGNFGGLNAPMAGWAYAALNAALVLAAAGLIAGGIRGAIAARRSGRAMPRPHAPLILCLLWGGAVLVSWAGWARVTWSSQGRLVFPAISVWSLLLALGLAGWLPRRWRDGAGAALGVSLLILAAAAPFVWIAPVYALPAPLTEAQTADIPSTVDADFGGVMRLLGYRLDTDVVEPGGQVGVTLYWEARAPSERDETVFVHLLGEGDLLVAQRDTFPGLGLLSTTWLEPGYRWADRYVLQVPATAYAPDQAEIEVGLYDAVTGARLTVAGGGDHVRFGRVHIQARAGETPNPISVNFGDRMALVGYELDRRVLRPGETAALTLYWRGLRRMETNYTVSAQFVDAAQVKAAQRDGWPADGAAPTAAWTPGALVADARALTIAPEAPPGVYDVRIAVYVLEGEGFVHLPVISARGEMLGTHVVLTRVRVVSGE